MSELDGRVALVTGSSRGIGAAIATLFACEGARVAVHGRDEAALDAVRAENLPGSRVSSSTSPAAQSWSSGR
ncbi:MAG TPA: SDR family NAD(P)-dependent oxidoreductase [Polyangia bacterium]|jgi:NAD(P)-dependent dehydrogenase (short-subunit alcohol dehydrogenase family)|nr:SDR family NAD(P)-dependent oxidoreductase [Polyangia bacterium]